MPSALRLWSSWESLDVGWVASLEKSERPAFFSSACLLQYNVLIRCFCTMASLMTFRTSSHFSCFILSTFNPRAIYTRGYKIIIIIINNNKYYFFMITIILAVFKNADSDLSAQLNRTSNIIHINQIFNYDKNMSLFVDENV